MKPALEMVASTEKKKRFDPREHLVSKSSSIGGSIAATPYAKSTTLKVEVLYSIFVCLHVGAVYIFIYLCVLLLCDSLAIPSNSKCK